MADDITHYDAVEGYAGRLSYLPGEDVTLHVSCTTARYDVVIERWGVSREVVWSAQGVEGHEQTTPVDADARGCGWPAALTLPISLEWTSGFYLVTLHAHEAPEDRATSYASFVVRAGVARARALLVLATNTYNAYNNWGGRSLYTGGKQVSFRRPFGRGMLVRPVVERDDRKARPRRPGEDPDVDGAVYQELRYRFGFPGFMSSAGWFTYERQFVEWAEADGLEFDYAVSSDLEQVPEVVDGYDVVIGAGHDEYWAAGQRATIEGFIRQGGTYVSLSGNTCFWQVRLEDGGDTADVMVCHKYTAHETDSVFAAGHPEQMTGMWC